MLQNTCKERIRHTGHAFSTLFETFLRYEFLFNLWEHSVVVSFVITRKYICKLPWFYGQRFQGERGARGGERGAREPRMGIISPSFPPKESKSNCFRARGAEREAPTKVGAIENPFLSAEKPHSKSYHHRRNRAFSAVALRKILS